MDDALADLKTPIATPVPATISPSASPRVRQMLPPLLFATLVCFAMLAARYGYAGRVRFSGLFGNLLLAWIPMVFALLVWRLHHGAVPRRAWFWLCAVCWFLFFPNALYIVTDLVHLKKYGLDGVPKWFDLLVIMAHALAGLFLGCLSLYLMELLVRARFGHRAGWGFAVGMLALGSFGIYLGRFVRLNSWDVVKHPFKLLTDVAALAQPMKAGEVLAFSVTFFFFSLAAYWFVVRATRFHAAP
ncbi:MAG: hypothetical protein QOE70_1710 [Chthoniobacter sp.]|jgi:uncharacterized membrane protein|nr:hypothetical protein [Chthoniobacter sp.]